jgi:hypothetical protein
MAWSANLLTSIAGIGEKRSGASAGLRAAAVLDGRIRK